MSELRVVTLGTSSGKPTPSRGVAAVAVVLDGVLALFDCGEGTQLQFIRAGLKPSRTAVTCISHFHGDHINGLPGYLSTLGLNQHDKPVSVVGPQGLRDYFSALRRLQILVPRYRLKAFEIRNAGEVFRNELFSIRAAPVDHRIATWAFRLEEHSRPGRFDLDRAKALGVPPGPLFGRLQRGEAVTLESGAEVRPDQVLGPSRPGRTVVYVTDTRPCEAAVELARGADLLVHEGTYAPGLEREAHGRGHCTVADAAHIAKAAGVKQLVVTHISPKHPDVRELGEAAREIFPNTHVARDFSEYNIPVPE